jgi:hypothetical protein
MIIAITPSGLKDTMSVKNTYIVIHGRQLDLCGSQTRIVSPL